MRNLLLLTLLIMTGCKTEKGTFEHLGTHEDSGVEVYRYYYDDNCFVYISKFKDSPINTVTWTERHGKSTTTQGNIILENDSIVIMRKPTNK